jgi:outer membrane lipoprotein carrier protein
MKNRVFDTLMAPPFKFKEDYMKRTALLGLTLMLILPAPVLAISKVNVGLSDVIGALETPFKVDAVRERGTSQSAIVDFQADFFQESLIASLDRTQRGRGRVAVKFDRTQTDRVPLTMFRWDYYQPTTQEIVSDGKTMWVYLPENRQVIQTDIEFSSRSRPNDPVTFLTGLGNLSRDFLITWAEPNQDIDGNYVLELRPRRPSAMIQRMLIVVDRDAVLRADPDFQASLRMETGDIFPILSTTVYDPNGNSTIIEFSGVRVNRGLSDADFQFILPAGVEVLRPTGSEMGF